MSAVTRAASKGRELGGPHGQLPLSSLQVKATGTLHGDYPSSGLPAPGSVRRWLGGLIGGCSIRLGHEVPVFELPGTAKLLRRTNPGAEAPTSERSPEASTSGIPGKLGSSTRMRENDRLDCV